MTFFYADRRASLKPLSERGRIALARLLVIAERYVNANWSRPSVQAFIDLPRGPYHDYG